MIQLSHVKKNYPAFTLDIETLNVQPGRITGLVGANGSGKTTTFKLLTQLARPDAGTLTLFDRDIHELSVADKQKIGVVFNDSGFQETLTPKDVEAILAAFFLRFEKSRFESLLRTLEVPMNKKIQEFSTGMKVRLKIAAAISHDPDLLILDEPTSGLDVIARRQIHELLQTYMENENHAILISSHIASDLEDLCDDFYVIHAGIPVLHETVQRLKDEYGILHLNEAQFQALDRTAAIAWEKKRDGADVLVSDRAFYEENMPGIVCDNGNIDDLLVIMEKGERA